MRTAALTLLLLLVPVSLAGAGSGAARHAKATLAGCDTQGNTALFRGSISSYKKATSLQLRFTLQAKVSGGGGFKRVVAPTFDTWLSSTPGKKRYVYDKTVENLEDGASYRAVVRFRWRDAKGALVASAIKVTGACAQPDDRPDLTATKVSVKAGTAPSNRTYVVKVANHGRSPAPVFATGLTVGGAPRPDQSTTGPLAAGASVRIAFVAPRCAAESMLTATVDTGAAVDERNEADNVLAVLCPTRQGRNGSGSSLD